MKEKFSKQELLAITEVFYVIENLDCDFKDCIPLELYNFFKDYSDPILFHSLNINDQNIMGISELAKTLLKIIEVYLKKNF